MKIEACRFKGADNISYKRIMILIDEGRLLKDSQYKLKTYNDIFDVLCSTPDELMDEISRINNGRCGEKDEDV